MAATVLLLTRVLLLGILFTEVLSAGAKVNGIGRSKSEAGGSLWLEIKPRGELVLGRNRGATLSCSGSQIDRITWLYNGEVAPPCAPHQRCILQRNGSLRLNKKKPIGHKAKGNNTTTIPHRNEYRCIAHTSYGASFRSSPTNVLYAELKDQFDEEPEDVTVLEGEVTRLACRIGSIPSPPNISWFRDGEIIRTDHNRTKYAFISPGILFIRETQQSDAGSYRCEAINKFLNSTRKSKEAKLTVVARQHEESSPVSLFPQISYSYSPLNGADLLLACAASGYPRPTTSWTFIATDADAGKPRHQTLLDSSSGLSLLALRNISVENAGTYVCSVNNFADNSTETQKITVEVLVPPSFVKKPSNQICPNGRTARFECQAQGYPTPRIYWLKNAADITINGRRTVYVKEFNKMELAISATVPSDSGIYQCVAVNAAGEIWAAGRLQVNTSRNSPAAPTSLKCEARSPVKMFISWEPPKFLPFSNITAYTVHYRPVEGGQEEVSPPEPGNSTSVEVTKHLEPFTNYTFYVRLWNNHGASDQSTNITCLTNASVPKTAPKIYVNVISSSKLNVTWKPLTKKEAQGIVTEYKLEWRLSQQPSVRVRSFSPTVEQYVLTDLLPGEQYDLRVLARTELGWPNVSESQLGWVTVTMPSSNDLIQAQILVLNSTTIKFKWDFRSNSILQLTSWKILLKTEDNIIIRSANLTKDTTEYEFINLEPDVAYAIELCALNYAETVNCITKRADLKKITTSNAPTALEAVPLSSNSIGLSWISGSLNGSNLFEVCYNAVHLLNESATCVHVNSTKIVINKLKPFMLYQFRVKTFSNDTNDDTYSEIIECYTNEDVPGKVEDVEWFLINSTLVRVVWKEPKTINGVIQRYYVAYSIDNYEPKSSWNNVTVFGNKTSTSLPTLAPGKRYFVVIQAATKAGAGNPSEPIVILTGGSSSEIPSSLDETKPLPKTREDKKLGIILGIAISILSIFVCLSSMYCRKRYESLRSLRESAHQPLKSRVLTRNGNACCVDHSSTSGSQPAVMSNEIELAVLFPDTPISNNPSCDTKGGRGNGILESCVNEPLLSPWEINGTRKDLRITENPQYKQRVSEDSTKSQQQQHEDLQDMNSTQLTTINYDLGGSEESLNNNMGSCTSDGASDILTQKTVPAIIPVLEPNG